MPPFAYRIQENGKVNRNQLDGRVHKWIYFELHKIKFSCVLKALAKSWENVYRLTCKYTNHRTVIGHKFRFNWSIRQNSIKWGGKENANLKLFFVNCRRKKFTVNISEKITGEQNKRKKFKVMSLNTFYSVAQAILNHHHQHKKHGISRKNHNCNSFDDKTDLKLKWRSTKKVWVIFWVKLACRVAMCTWCALNRRVMVWFSVKSSATERDIIFSFCLISIQLPANA